MPVSIANYLDYSSGDMLDSLKRAYRTAQAEAAEPLYTSGLSLSEMAERVATEFLHFMHTPEAYKTREFHSRSTPHKGVADGVSGWLAVALAKYQCAVSTTISVSSKKDEKGSQLFFITIRYDLSAIMPEEDL